jgi:hypothetical protein
VGTLIDEIKVTNRKFNVPIKIYSVTEELGVSGKISRGSDFRESSEVPYSLLALNAV